MLGPIAPTGASISRAMSSVARAASSTASTASTSAEPNGGTGTVAERSTCGARPRSSPSRANAARDGKPPGISDGSSSTSAPQTPTTTTMPVSQIALTRRRSPTKNMSGGTTAAHSTGTSHPPAARTRVSESAAAAVRLARAMTTKLDCRCAAIAGLPRSRLRERDAHRPRRRSCGTGARVRSGSCCRPS